MDIFNKIVQQKFLINLEKRPERLAHAKAELSQYNIENVELVKAIDGNELGLKSEIKRLTPGMIGCYQTHRNIMKHCLDNNINSYVVFEDDLKLLPGFNDLFELAIAELPDDWEFVYLGATPHKGTTHIKRINDFWVLPFSVWGTQCFMIKNKQTIEKIYNALEVMKMQIDEQLTHLILRDLGIKHYCADPCMVGQVFELGSDVQDRIKIEV